MSFEEWLKQGGYTPSGTGAWVDPAGESMYGDAQLREVFRQEQRTPEQVARDDEYGMIKKVNPALQADFFNLLQQQTGGKYSEDQILAAIKQSNFDRDFRNDSNAPSAVAQVVRNLGGKPTITPEQVAAYNDTAVSRSPEAAARANDDEGFLGLGDLGKFALLAAGLATGLSAFAEGGAAGAAAEGSSAWGDAMAAQASEINSWMADAANSAAAAPSAAETLGGVTTSAAETVAGQGGVGDTLAQQIGGVSTDAASTITGAPPYTAADAAASGAPGTLTATTNTVNDGLYSDFLNQSAAQTGVAPGDAFAGEGSSIWQPSTSATNALNGTLGDPGIIGAAMTPAAVPGAGTTDFLQASAADTGVPAGTQPFPNGTDTGSIWQPDASATRALDGSLGTYDGALAPATGTGASIANTPTGIIDTILKGLKDNQQVASAAVGAGGQALAGAFKSDADKELLKAKVQAEADAALAKRNLIQSGSYFNANLPYKPSGAVLRRSDGTPVYNANGIIGRRIGA